MAKKPEAATAPVGNSVDASEELRSFIERYERLELDKKAIADDQKEIMAEAKGRGYDTKIMRRIMAERKRDPEEVAEEEGIMELYREALSMGHEIVNRASEAHGATSGSQADDDDDTMV